MKLLLTNHCVIVIEQPNVIVYQNSKYINHIDTNLPPVVLVISEALTNIVLK